MLSPLGFKGTSIKVPHFIVVDPGVKTPEFDTFNLISSLSPLPCTYQMPAMFGFEAMPSELSNVRGVIILGSLASVYDHLPWQLPLEQWTQMVVDQGIPVLGCCYGFQMLAHMYGGKVEFISADKRKFQGVRVTDILENPLCAKSTRRLVVTHNEHVTKLPNDFVAIASSSEIPIDGFAHKNKHVFGFQAHLEATKLFLNDRQMASESSFAALDGGHDLIRSFVHMAAKISW